MSRPLGPVFFLSDFGGTGEFAGVVKAVIARLAPEVGIIDLTHEVPAFDVRAGALALGRAAPYLGEGVVLAVVDPGVATARRAVALSPSWAGGRGRDGDRTGSASAHGSGGAGERKTGSAPTPGSGSAGPGGAGSAGTMPRYWVGPDNGLLLPALGVVAGLPLKEAFQVAANPAGLARSLQIDAVEIDSEMLPSSRAGSGAGGSGQGAPEYTGSGSGENAPGSSEGCQRATSWGGCGPSGAGQRDEDQSGPGYGGARQPSAAARTFDGRDVFGPAVALLASGASLSDIGTHVDAASLAGCPLARCVVSEGRLACEVIWIDRFGNAELFASEDDLVAALASISLARGTAAGAREREGSIGAAGRVGVIVGHPASGGTGSGHSSAPLGIAFQVGTVGTFAELPRGEAGILTDSSGLVSIVVIPERAPPVKSASALRADSFSSW